MHDIKHDILFEFNSDALVLEEYDTAFIGIGFLPAGNVVAVYDYDKLFSHLTCVDNLSEEEATEHIAYTITGSYVGSDSPIVIQLFDNKGT